MSRLTAFARHCTEYGRWLEFALCAIMLTLSVSFLACAVAYQVTA